MAPSLRLASYSNYGRQSVHIAAPGEKIFSNVPGDAYEYRSGTSVATPFVSGVAALVYGAFAGAGSHPVAQEVKDILRVSSAPVEDLADDVAWGSMLDAEAAVIVAHLGGMWTQVKCTDKVMTLEPGASRAAVVYVRPYLPGDYKAKIHVEVFSGSQLTAAGGFDMKISSNEYIPTETKQLNTQKALEAEVAFSDHLINDSQDTDLCGVQKKYLFTASVAEQQGDGQEREESAPTSLWIATAGAGVAIILLAGALFAFRKRLRGSESGALEEFYDAALEDEESPEPPSFGDTLEKKTSHKVKFDDDPSVDEGED